MTRRNFLCGLGGATVLVSSPAPGEADLERLPSQAQESSPTRPPAADDGVGSEEFTVEVGHRVIQPRLVSPPPGRLAQRPLLLLSLSADRETALTAPPYCLGTKLFLAHGHRAVSFDLPNHGKRVDKYGEGIQGWRNAWVEGHDCFEGFLEEASAVIGRCLERGQAEPGRVVVYGISRGGYLALRLLAADSRVAGAAAIAPVTDWRDLTEFSTERNRADLAGLRLSRYAEALAGKRIFLVIGNADERVSTSSCTRFFLDLLETKARARQGIPALEFHCAAMAEPGHSVDDSWRQLAAEFLLNSNKTP